MSLYFIALLILALFQRDPQRMLCGVIFFIITILSQAFSLNMPDHLFYLSCAAGSWLAIISLRFLSDCILSLVLQVLSFVSILINCVGFVLWYSFYSPVFYDSLFILVQACVLVSLLVRIGSYNDGCGSRASSCYSNGVYCDNNKLIFFNTKHAREKML